MMPTGTLTRRRPAPSLRYPFGPLIELCESIHPEPATIQNLARWLNTSPRQVSRWKVKGLTDKRADEVATHIGVHMSQVWPREYAEALVTDLFAIAKGRA